MINNYSVHPIKNRTYQNEKINTSIKSFGISNLQLKTTIGTVKNKSMGFENIPAPSNKVSFSLSQRELQILKLVKEGFLSKEISNKLNISLHTVNTHRQHFLEKLGANNSMEAVSFAIKLGLLE